MSIAAIEESGLVVVLEFLAPSAFWRWRRTCRRCHGNTDHMIWWLRSRLKPYAVDLMLRRAKPPLLWRMCKRLHVCLRMQPRTVMLSHSFPATFFDRYKIASKCCETMGLANATPELCDDESVVLRALRNNKNDASVLWYASPRLRATRSLVMIAVLHNGDALQHVGAALRADREIVRAAVRRCRSALRYASPELRDSESTVATSIDRYTNNGGVWTL